MNRHLPLRLIATSVRERARCIYTNDYIQQRHSFKYNNFNNGTPSSLVEFAKKFPYIVIWTIRNIDNYFNYQSAIKNIRTLLSSLNIKKKLKRALFLNMLDISADVTKPAVTTRLNVHSLQSNFYCIPSLVMFRYLITSVFINRVIIVLKIVSYWFHQKVYRNYFMMIFRYIEIYNIYIGSNINISLLLAYCVRFTEY